MKAPRSVWAPSVLLLADRARALLDAQRASEKLADKRLAHPPGSTRARVTTANARWANAAEARDHAEDLYREAVETEAHRLGLIGRPARASVSR